MTNWKKPSQELPPQGKKVLYFKKGDIYVVQRIGDMWLPIPFYDSVFAFTDAPELWADIDAPTGFTGKMMVGVKGKIVDLDTLETQYPDTHTVLYTAQKEIWTKSLRERRLDSLSKDWEK